MAEGVAVDTLVVVVVLRVVEVDGRVVVLVLAVEEVCAVVERVLVAAVVLLVTGLPPLFQPWISSRVRT